jgi:hypothetical protein
MNMEDVRVDSYFDSKIMPYGMKCTHMPTGLSVTGNCKNEGSQNQLQRTLLDQLAIFVGQHEAKEGITRRVGDQAENDMLRAQLAAMQEQIIQLIAKMPADGTKIMAEQPSKSVAKRLEVQTEPPKVRKGWPKGKPRKAKTAQADTPTGEMTEAELIKQQMRPPTDRPVPLPKDHISHGSTVAKVSPELQAKGVRP